MKNLFDPSTANEVKTRFSQLSPQSHRLWGKMTAPQMVAHCAGGMAWAVGDTVPEKAPFPLSLIGRVIKPMVFRNDDPMRRNAPTLKSLIISDQRDLNYERDRLTSLIDRFVAGGAPACTSQRHPFFGSLTPDQWAILMYKHLDHHLRQFSV